MFRSNRNLALAFLAGGSLFGGYLWSQAPATPASPPIAPMATSPAPSKHSSPATTADPTYGAPVSPGLLGGPGGQSGPFGGGALPAIAGGGGGGMSSGIGLPTARYTLLSQANEKLNQAKIALKKSSTDEEKRKADDQLVQALNEYFDQDMVQRKKELAEVKKRMEDLEKQLQKRESSKNDIVDLQKKVIVNEVNGLGFYGSGNASPLGSIGGVFSEYRTPPAVPAPATPAAPIRR